MPLSAELIDLIRDEIGPDDDFANNTADLAAGQLGALEAIYNSTNRGDFNVLRTALICWRLRLAAYVKRGFDVTSAGSLLARRQRMKELSRLVKHYEILVDTTHKATNARVLSTYEQEETDSEFA